MQEAHLAEVVVLGDDHEPLLAGMRPDLGIPLWTRSIVDRSAY